MTRWLSNLRSGVSHYCLYERAGEGAPMRPPIHTNAAAGVFPQFSWQHVVVRRRVRWPVFVRRRRRCQLIVP